MLCSVNISTTKARLVFLIGFLKWYFLKYWQVQIGRFSLRQSHIALLASLKNLVIENEFSSFYVHPSWREYIFKLDVHQPQASVHLISWNWSCADRWYACLCVFVCLCVCLSLRLLITSGVIGYTCDINLIWLGKQVLQLLYGNYSH